LTVAAKGKEILIALEFSRTCHDAAADTLRFGTQPRFEKLIR